MTGASLFNSIGGGSLNLIGGASLNNHIGSGTTNTILGASLNSAIGSGLTNSIIGASLYGFIGSGQLNNIAGATLHSFIGSGNGNQIVGIASASSIASGRLNAITAGTGSSIGAGQFNIITGSNNGNISAGMSNSITTADNSTIGGGLTNIIGPGSAQAVIGGGTTNSIVTGSNNTISGGTIINITSGNGNTVSGGSTNTVTTGNNNAISGGSSNTVLAGNGNSIVGGSTNTVTIGNNNAILGGSGNSVAGGHAFALGQGNNALLAGGFALGNGATAGLDEFSSKFNGGNKMESVGLLNGSYTLTLKNPLPLGNGISIEVATLPTTLNRFVDFRGVGGISYGKITGQTLLERQADPEYIEQVRQYTADIAFAATSASLAALQVTCGVAHVGLNPPGAAAEAAVGAAESVAAASEAIEAGVRQSTYITLQTVEHTPTGVAYQSGAADYAEWLPKSDLDEKFFSGDIVGVKGGSISKNTDGTTQLMVISSAPIVLGNMKSQEEEHKYEKVAFMGQVPVRIKGTVSLGDYILPSGDHNGFGIAVAPEHMLASDFKRVVGVAWSEAKNSGINTINVAVGLNANALSTVVDKQQEIIVKQQAQLQVLQSSLNKTNSALTALVPGFAEKMSEDNSTMSDAIPSVSLPAPAKKEPMTKERATMLYEQYSMNRANAEALLQKTQSFSASKGLDVNTIPIYRSFNENPIIREVIIEEFIKTYNAKVKSIIESSSSL